jgi:hypothetical protein
MTVLVFHSNDIDARFIMIRLAALANKKTLHP